MRPAGTVLSLLAPLILATSLAASFHASDEFVISPTGDWPAVAFNGEAFAVAWFEPVAGRNGGALTLTYLLPNNTRVFAALSHTLSGSEVFNGPLALSANGNVTSFFWTEPNASIKDRQVNQLMLMSATFPLSFTAPRVLAPEVGADAVKRYDDEAYSGFAMASSDSMAVVTYARNGAIYCRTSLDSFANEVVVASAADIATSSASQLRSSVAFSGRNFLVTWFEPAGDHVWALRGSRIGTDATLIDRQPRTVATYDVPAGSGSLSPPIGPYHHSVTIGGAAPLVQFQTDGMTSNDPYTGLEEHREFVDPIGTTSLYPHTPTGLLRYQGVMRFFYPPDEACRTVYDGTAYVSVCPDYYFSTNSIIICPAADDRGNPWSFRVQRRDGDGTPTDSALTFPDIGFHHGFGVATGNDGTSLLVYGTERGIVGRFLNEKPVPHRRAVH